METVNVSVQEFFMPFKRPLEDGNFEVLIGCVIVCLFQANDQAPTVGSLNYQILGANYDQDTSYELIQKYCNELFKDAKSYMLANCDELGCY